jgi:type IV pilus assembly protein PilO
MLGIPKDPAGQKRFLIGALPLLAVAGYYQFFHGAKATVVADLETRHEVLLEANGAASAKANPAAQQQLQQKLSLFENHMRRLEELIPAREEVPQLLLDITQRSRDAGVEPARIAPVGEEPGEHYIKSTYDVRVIGPYHAIGRFLAQIGSLPRIVTPTDVRVVKLAVQPQNIRDAQIRLQADFKIHTYVIPPPPPDTVKPPVPAGTTPPATTTNAGN